MTIYRIEHKETGIGPYKTEGQDYYKANLHWGSKETHPSWGNDFNFSTLKEHFAGVQNISLLLHWFPVKSLILLSSLNYVLHVYEVIPDKISSFQVIFIKNELIMEYNLPKSSSSMYRFLNNLKGAA